MQLSERALQVLRLQDRGPVSYTHLDVYKRQVRHSVQEIEKSLCIHHMEEETGLRVVGAMYHIEDGSVEFL